jgi:uncharacterized secreted protein with C-terminal beta-propeller domain
MRRLTSTVAVALLLVTGCGREGPLKASDVRTPPPSPSTSPPSTPKPRPKPASTAASLERFDACPELLTHLRSQALARVGPYGLDGYGGRRMLAATDAAAPAAEGPAAMRTDAAPAFSGTNVQERDVDEPDTVKTDGRYLYTLRAEPGDRSRQRLASVALEGGGPRLVGGVLLPQAPGYELMLAGSRVLAIAREGYFGVLNFEGGSTYAPPEARTVVAVVDVSDPANMRIANKLVLDGAYVSARMVNGIARIVLSSTTARVPVAQPSAYSEKGLKAAIAKNKDLIARTTIDQWLPRFKLQDSSGAVADEGPLVSCAQTYHPKTFSGFGTVSVVTIDPSDPNPRNSAAVLGGSATVYASTHNLYVATQVWPEPRPFVMDARATVPDAAKTYVHRFDIADRANASYAASGEVVGTVLNQWSLSEYDGFLRVATTDERFDAPSGSSSQSYVTVLTARGPKLAEVGRVGNIGTGERIYGVRFMGSTGYVVTFRQFDPLHVVDLSVPTRPRVLGELEIPGYSAYLHPVGDGLLLGVGAVVKSNEPAGTLLSLFDVRDPTHPTRLDKVEIDGTSSPVTFDHHAFLWWEPRHLAAIPIDFQELPQSDPPPASTYLYGFRVIDGAITKVGRVTHDGHGENGADNVTRSFMVGDVLYSVSAAGVMASDPDKFVELGWASFG